MVNMIKEKEENRKKMIPTVITGVISTVAFITLILVVGVYADVISTPVKVLLILIACAIFGLGIFVAAEGERTIGYYKCRKCGKHFVPTVSEYTFGPHMITTRHLKCHHCGKTSWCKKVLSKDDEE